MLAGEAAGGDPAGAGADPGGDSSCAKTTELTNKNAARNLIVIGEMAFITLLVVVGQVRRLPKNSVAALYERRHI